MTTRTLKRLERARADARLRWQLAHVELRESVHAWIAACDALVHAQRKARRGKDDEMSDEPHDCIIDGKICRRWCGGVHCLPSYTQGVWCPKCYWYGDQRELLDGETCPNCRLVLP